MKIHLLLIFLVFFSAVKAQEADPITRMIEIAKIEKRAHEKLHRAERTSALTSASQNFNVNYYRCEWEVTPTVQFISGKVTSHYQTTAAGSSIAFDLANNLTVSSVTQRNVAIPFTQGNNTLTINFPVAFGTGVKDSVTVVYAGQPTGADGYFTVSTHGSAAAAKPVLWTLSEPFGSREWWPCKNGLDDKADSIDVYITHPSAYKGVANGIQVSQTNIAGSKTVTHWKHRYPIASYLVSLAVADYTVLNNSVMVGADNIAMQTFCYADGLANFTNGANIAMDAISLFSAQFGTYPFKNEKYGHVQFDGGGGMEHQTNSFMTSMDQGLISHELGHQWFGDKVTCASWEDIWLNEGFATHLQYMYSEYKQPQNTTSNRTAVVNFITSAPDGSVRVDNVNDINRIFDNRLSYYKGSYLLYMLRWILSDNVFKTAINNYLNDPALAYGYATTANLKSHLEAASGRNLTYFFDQWYTGQGYPSYQVQWYPVGNKVQIKLSQTTSHPSVSFFRLPVPLLFRNTVTNEQKLVTLNHTFSGQMFSEELGFVPNTVIFDPSVWLVTRNNTITKESGPLPVTFVSFQAECAGNGVTLKWETSEETGADRFEIQKSADAANWENIGTVKAVGDSKVLNKYEFTHPAPGAQRSYYRLLEVDVDGTKQYTRIIASSCIVLGAESQPDCLHVTIKPNPVKNRLIFDADNPGSGNLQAAIFTVSGAQPSAGLKNILVRAKNDIDISSLPSGLYLLVLSTDDQKPVQTVRFLKE
ncbi:M1 family aminopeptidase [Dyadobacter luticola]|uniref:Aminopeptidase N n=1 Tax=Dyadobacter luticola TaxID=1979387 RepID=A0A5R9L168_9BACT|nr:M1 family aminopeptidase [Dyadobacter luticola]TLV02296.1 T9SS type A sorting domain-containing protein [Dyadobacter luticola]